MSLRSCGFVTWVYLSLVVLLGLVGIPLISLGVFVMIDLLRNCRA